MKFRFKSDHTYILQVRIQALDEKCNVRIYSPLLFSFSGTIYSSVFCQNVLFLSLVSQICFIRWVLAI